VQSPVAHPESCPVLKTADIISGKWTLLILRDLANGINRFSALERSLVGISPKTLSERLKSLEKSGVVTRKSFAEVPPRVEYSLTEMGLDLIPLVEHMREYGNKWLGNGSQKQRTT
jgi:DNA-binding HxlR family transcriptional regulator